MTDLALPADLAPAPTTLFASDDPDVIVARATRIADAIAPLIRDRHLVKRIGQSEHVYLEGWTLAGSMLGVFATTVRTWEIGDDTGYGATVEARTMTGNVVGRADAVVMRSEEVGGKRKWLDAPAFQLISMAQTRGSSKALRMPLGFVMKLAGYETTPAEEMEAAAARGESVSGGRGVRPGWKDVAEQQRAHAEVGVLIDNLGIRGWVAEWLDSKGYERPLAKAQLNQLRKAIEREFEQSGAGSSTATEAAGDSASGSPVPDPKDTSGSVGERPTKTASPTEPEVANHDRPGARETPPSPDATEPPDGSSPPRRPSGGTQRSGRGGTARQTGKAGEPHPSPAGTDEHDPGRSTR